MVTHFALADYVEVTRLSLSSVRQVVALACKRCNRQYFGLREYANQRHTTHLCASCGHKWDVVPQIKGNLLAALGY